MHRYLLLLCSLAPAVLAERAPMTLEQAVAQARGRSAERRAAQMQVRAAEQAVAAVGAWPDPELEVEVENLGGDYGVRGTGEYTVGLYQTIPLGGKRRKARRAAREAAQSVEYDAAERALALDEYIRRAYTEVAFLRMAVAMGREQDVFERALVEEARQRRVAGRGADLEVLQAELLLEENRLKRRGRKSELTAAEARLASLLGMAPSDLPDLVLPFREDDLLAFGAVGEDHPRLRRLGAEADAVRADAIHARSQDVVDVTFGAGYRHEAEEGIDSFLFSVSMPLSFARRGRADYAAGLLREEALRYEREAVCRELQADWTQAVVRVTSAMEQVQRLRTVLIPKADQAVVLVRTGYESGRFSWRELLVARQQLADLRREETELLHAASLARIEIMKLEATGIYP